MPVTHCPQGHEIRSAADRGSQSYCKRCRADYDKRRRAGKEAALLVVKAFEAAGCRLVIDGQPVNPADAARQLGELWAQGAFDAQPS